MFRLCTSLDWDKDGDLLAATQERSGETLIYYTPLSLLYVCMDVMYVCTCNVYFKPITGLVV